MLQDIHYALRMMKRSPLLTSIILLTLALGTGANVAIFTAIKAVLLPAPAAVHSFDQLVMVWDAVPKLGEHRLPMTAAEYINYSQNAKSIHMAAGFASQDVTLTGYPESERVTGARISANLFPLLGVNPAKGRIINTEEDQANSARVVLLSDALWHRRYGADPNIVGRSIEIDRQPYLVIGLMPRSFIFPFAGTPFSQPAGLWIPLALTPDEIRSTSANFGISVIARLKPGISVLQSSDEAANIATTFYKDHPELNTGNLQISTSVVGLRTLLSEDVRTFLLLLLGAVAGLLLIVCANVANLLLAKSLARSYEIGVRAALGAARKRLIRQLLIESMLLALIAGAAGLLVAFAMIKAMGAFAPQQIGWPANLALDPVVLLFTQALAIVTGIGFGLAPALQMSRVDLSNSMRGSSNYTVAGSDRGRLRQGLAIGETALSVVLLICAGLLVNSFLRVLQVAPGFDADHVFVAHTVFDKEHYQDSQVRIQAEKNILDRLSAFPGTTAAAAAVLPLDNEIRVGVRVDTEAFNLVHIVEQDSVSPDYFHTMGIPLLQGSSFSDHDLPDSPLVAVVSQGFAKRYWPGENPIGRQIKWGRDRAPFSVVGLVPDIKVSGLDADPLSMIYTSRFQITDSLSNDVAFVISAKGSPENFTSAFRAQVSSVDKDLPLFRMGSMRQVISKSLAKRQFSMVLLSLFSLMSLLLAAGGLYAVISHLATERTREFGVRMALGAPRSHVLRLVLHQAGTLVAIGLALGVAAACGLSHFMHTMIYGISPLDPLTFIGISFLFCLVALAASFFPAFRASHSDPLAILKSQ